MSRGGKSNLLIALGALVMAAGVVLALDLPDEVFSQEPEPKPVQIDLDAAVAKVKAAEDARIRRLMTSKFVLGVPRATLDTIAECESHGDPKAIGGGGLYRGKYQFDRGTWQSVGGKGDPAKAHELEQDRRAAALYKRSGSSPWPVCGV